MKISSSPVLGILFAGLIGLSIGAAKSVQAGILQAPPSFPYTMPGALQPGIAVFVDFESADYSIVYDFPRKVARVESEITFEALADGFPIFDLVVDPDEVSLDGKAVTTTVVSDPDSASRYRVVNAVVTRGHHRLSVKHRMEEGVSFTSRGVASAFWMSDLDDREYLENYLPANLEFDQVPMKMKIEILGAGGIMHTVRANGAVTELGPNRFEVEFPVFYTASSLFLHLMPRDAVESLKFDYPSVDGRMIPVEVYAGRSLSAFAAETRKTLTELEKDYGPFPHAKVIVYGSGSGGMEYSGATVTSVSALGHELFHSYNARAVMPAQGNAGWIDEAMSSWRDEGYASRATPSDATRMAGHSKWTRKTDTDAYTEGEAFLAWISTRMRARGLSLKVFLREYFTNHFYTTVTTADFEHSLEKFTGMDLSQDFRKLIYGLRNSSGNGSGNDRESGKSEPSSVWIKKKLALSPESAPTKQSRFHPRLTKKELRELLWP